MKHIVLTVFLILSGIFTSCFNSQRHAESAKEDGPAQVVFYTWSDGNNSLMSNMFDAFNAAGTDIQIDPRYIPADYETKLTTLLAGGMEMDAYMQKRSTDMFSQNANGYIEPLDELMKKNDFDPASIDSWSAALKVDGKTLAIPYRSDRHFTYYNVRPFEEKGLPTPTELVERGEWTWNRFVSLSQELSENDGVTFGSNLYIWGNVQVYPAVQEGVEFIDSKGNIDINEWVLRSARIRKILEDGNDMPKLIDQKVTKTHYTQTFYSGGAPILLIGQWFPGLITRGFNEGRIDIFEPEDFRITRLPSDSPRYYSVGSPTMGHVAARSKDKDAAFKALSWFCTPAGAEAISSFGVVPVVMSDRVKANLAENIPDPGSLDYYTEDVPTRPFFYTKYGSKVEQVISRFTESYLLGEISDDDYLSEMEKELRTIVDTTG